MWIHVATKGYQFNLINIQLMCNEQKEDERMKQSLKENKDTVDDRIEACEEKLELRAVGNKDRDTAEIKMENFGVSFLLIKED